MSPLRVLLVEDQPDDAELVLRALKAGGLEVAHERVFSGTDLKAALAKPWDIVISDYSMPSFTGFNAYAIVKEFAPDLPFIIVSGTVGEETAVDAMRIGVQDYVLKDRLARLVQVVKRELEQARNRVQLREKDRQLLQAQKMEVVGRLAGGIAHDFNNILVIILLYCDSLRGHLGEDHPHVKEVEQIAKAGERAAELTKKLLAFSRQQVIRPQRVNLNDLIVDIEPMLTRLIGESVRLRRELAAELDFVDIDTGSFQQVVLNLAANARDAMGGDGVLTIRTSNVDQASERNHVPPGAYVKLSVSDTGHGMDENTKSRIFEPFFTTKAAGLGTGLGLSTVFGIVQQSDGFVTVDSRPGHGSTFHIYLKKSDGQKESAEAISRSAPAVQNKGVKGARVLLIEDDEGVRQALCEILRAAGADVLPPKSPREALDYAAGRGHEFDIVVCDVMMPEMTGPAFVAKLRERVPGAKALFMSGYLEMPTDEFERLRDDAHFLQKPFPSRLLVDKVNEILDSPR